MSTSTTEVTNRNLSPRDISRRTGRRPFVVCSMNTKRYAPPLSTKPPAVQLQRFPLRNAIKTRPSVSPEAPTSQQTRSDSLPTVVPKAKSNRASAPLRPAPIPVPSRATKALQLPAKVHPQRDKMFKPMRTSRGGEAGPLWASLEFTQDDLPPRPSCVPRSRILPVASGLPVTGKGKPGVDIKVAAGACNRGVDCKVSADTRMSNTVRCTRASSLSADWSPLPSPDLSSFLSQTRTIVVSADSKRNKTSTTICSDETPSTVGDEPKPSEEESDETSSAICGDRISLSVRARNDSTCRMEEAPDVGDGLKVPLETIGCLHTEPFAFPDDWSPPPSPIMSSFPSQTWMVLVNTGAQQNKTAITDCDGKILGPSSTPAAASSEGISHGIRDGNKLSRAQGMVETQTTVRNVSGGLKVPSEMTGYAHTKHFAFPADWSPPPSPNMSSFPSQSWTVLANTGTKLNKPVTQDFDGEIPSSMPATINGDGICRGTQTEDEPTSGVEGTVKGTVEIQTMIGGDAISNVGDELKVPSMRTGYTHTEPFAFPADWSPPPSPNMASFPSQSWTVCVDTGVKEKETPTMVCNSGTPFNSNSGSSRGTDDTPATTCSDGTPYSTSDESKYGVATTVETLTMIGTYETPPDDHGGFTSRTAGMLDESCTPPDLSILTLPSIVESPTWHTTCVARLEETGGPSNPTLVDPSVGVSSMVCPATIIPPSENGATSMARLARLMDRRQTSSGGNRTQTIVSHAVRVARTLFLPVQHGLQSREAAPLPIMGAGVSRIHRRFVPVPEKGVRQDKDPTVQKKIVAGWW